MAEGVGTEQRDEWADLVTRLMLLEAHRPGSFEQIVAFMGDGDMTARFKARFGREPAANDR